MLRSCGYNMVGYWQHWLEMGGLVGEAQLPGVFQVNWFRKDSDGRFLGPGFAENARGCLSG